MIREVHLRHLELPKSLRGWMAALSIEWSIFLFPEMMQTLAYQLGLVILLEAVWHGSEWWEPLC